MFTFKVKRDCLVQSDHQVKLVTEDYKDHLDLPAFRVQWVINLDTVYPFYCLLVILSSLAHCSLLFQVCKDPSDKKVPPVNQDRKATRVQQVQLVHRVNLVHPVSLDLLDQKAIEVMKDVKVTQDSWVRLAVQVILVLPVNLAILVLKVHLGYLASKELKVTLVKQDSPDLLVILVNLVYPEAKVKQDPLDPSVCLVSWVNLATLVIVVSLVLWVFKENLVSVHHRFFLFIFRVI